MYGGMYVYVCVCVFLCYMILQHIMHAFGELQTVAEYLSVITLIGCSVWEACFCLQ